MRIAMTMLAASAVLYLTLTGLDWLDRRIDHATQRAANADTLHHEGTLW